MTNDRDPDDADLGALNAQLWEKFDRIWRVLPSLGDAELERIAQASELLAVQHVTFAEHIRAEQRRRAAKGPR